MRIGRGRAWALSLSLGVSAVVLGAGAALPTDAIRDTSDTVPPAAARWTTGKTTITVPPQPPVRVGAQVTLGGTVGPPPGPGSSSRPVPGPGRHAAPGSLGRVALQERAAPTEWHTVSSAPVQPDGRFDLVVSRSTPGRYVVRVQLLESPSSTQPPVTSQPLTLVVTR